MLPSKLTSQSSALTLVIGLLFYLAIIPLLLIVPRWFPMDGSVASAAAAEDYNSNMTFFVTFLWVIGGVALFAVLQFFGYLDGKDHQASDTDRVAAGPALGLRKLFLIEIAVVLIGVTILYFPPFLVKYGPYIEDKIFLNALHRMQSGQRPYVDFEFLYGPLMLYLPFLWTKIVGFSMQAFYWYLLIIEAVVFIALAVLVQYFVPNKTAARYAIFLLMAVFLFNTLLAPNQNGIRKFLPVIVILIITSRPDSFRNVLTGSVLLGLQLAYSHEYGIASLVAITAMYGLLTLNSWSLKKYPPFAVLVGVVAAITWFVTTLVVMGSGFQAYIGEVLYLIGRFSAGEAAFRFYWTANALALYGLLGLACFIIGRGLVQIRREPLKTGDLLLFSGLVYTLIGLKSGLNRVDLWHLEPAILLLAAAFVLPTRKTLFAYSRPVQRLAASLIVVMAATYLLGLLPTGSYFIRGLANGFLDTVRPQQPVAAQSANTRAPTVELERSHPDQDVLELAEYLAEQSREDYPVVFYNDVWSLGINVGVYRTTFLNDDFLYSDERGESVRYFLQQQEKAIVIIRKPTYLRLFGMLDVTQFPEYYQRYQLSFTKSLASWLSTVHYTGVEEEYLVREQRWQRTVGDYVATNYESVAEFGEFVVLMPKQMAYNVSE